MVGTLTTCEVGILSRKELRANDNSYFNVRMEQELCNASTSSFTDMQLDNLLPRYDYLNMTRFRFVMCKEEEEEVVNSDASRGNSSFFSKLSAACVLPAKSGHQEVREDCNPGGGGRWLLVTQATSCLEYS